MEIMRKMASGQDYSNGEDSILSDVPSDIKALNPIIDCGYYYKVLYFDFFNAGSTCIY